MNLTPQQVEFLRSKHLQISIPCYAGLVHEVVMTSLLKFAINAQRLGMNFSLDTMTNESLIPRGRSHLVAKFMENSLATHQLWIDSDIQFEAEHIFQLLLHDKDMVGGLYPKKNLPIDYVVNVSPEAVDQTDGPTKGHIKTTNGLIPVSRLGTGFMMVKRNVYERMFKAYPETKFTNNIGLDKKYDPFVYALYDCVISKDTNEYLSEDWTMCARFRAIGGEIFADPNILLGHAGTFLFPGNPKNLYNMLGLDPEKNPQLMPRIAVRVDEVKNGAAHEAHKPNYEAIGLTKPDFDSFTEDQVIKAINSQP